MADRLTGQYHFDEEIDRHNTSCIKWDVYPEDYLPLFIADMDFAVPPEITERIIKRAEHPVYGYTKPQEEVFSSFINWFQSEYGSKLVKSWIHLIPGIVPALAVASNVVSGKSMAAVPK